MLWFLDKFQWGQDFPSFCDVTTPNISNQLLQSNYQMQMNTLSAYFLRFKVSVFCHDQKLKFKLLWNSFEIKFYSQETGNHFKWLTYTARSNGIQCVENKFVTVNEQRRMHFSVLSWIAFQRRLHSAKAKQKKNKGHYSGYGRFAWCSAVDS